MRVRELEELFRYHYWATHRLLATVAQLTPEQFIQPVAGSYESIRTTLVHVLSAEWGWLERCGGQTRGPRLNPTDYPTHQSLTATWERVEGYMRNYLATLTDEDLARNVAFALAGGPRHSIPLGTLMLHAAIHAVHHRGQVALMLRMLGQVPGDFDLLFYAMQDPSAAAAPAPPGTSA